MDFTISSETYGYMAALIERTNAALATPPPEPPMELPTLLAAALKLREENDLSRLFLLKPTPPSEPTTSQITFNDSSTEEVIRLDKDGFHYKGQFIADAGEAHRLMLAFLKQHAKVEPEPPTDEEINALWNCCGNYDEEGDHYGNIFQFARAALMRWGAK
jgi:hypothetical protein